jgi:hypothetical protein
MRVNNAIVEGTRIGESTLANHTLCVDQCRQTAGCVAFQHHGQTRACVLFSSVGRRELAQDWRSGVRSDYRGQGTAPAKADAGAAGPVAGLTGEAAGRYDVRENAMLNGTELDNARVATFGECVARCDGNAACVGVQFDPNSTVCLMFSRITFRTAAANWRAAVKKGADRP